MSNYKIIKRVINYITPYKLNIIIVFFALITVSLTVIALGQSIKYFVDNGIANNRLNESILIIIGLILLFGLGSFIRSFYANFLAEKVMANIRNDLLKRLMSMKISFYDKSKINNIMNSITHHTELIGNIVINIISFLVRNILMSIGAFIMMLINSLYLTSIAILMLLVIIIPIIYWGKFLKELSKTTTKSLSNISNNIEEILYNIKIIYGFNQSNNVLGDLKSKNEKYLDLNRKRLYMRSLFFSVNITAILIIIILVIWIGSYSIINKNLEAGSFAAFIFYAMAIALNMAGIFEVLSEFPKYLAAANEVFNIIDNEEVEVDDKNLEEIKISKENFAIEFKNVNFYYPSNPSKIILQDLSFRLNSNNIIGIIGKSGFGKTTIINLIMKFYPLISGEILINNQDINKIKTKSLREIIGYVSQDPTIFSSTIFDNVIIANPDANLEEVKKSLELAQAKKFIDQLPKGVKTNVGSKGAELSGGQKQRIALARIFLKKPKIVILDESMSGIDSPTEDKIFSNLRNELPNSIIIVIGHRSSIMDRLDEIIVINEGRVIETGTHETLKTKSNFYYSQIKKDFS